MKDLNAELAKRIREFVPGDGNHPTPVPGVRCVQISGSRPWGKAHWRVCLGIMVQGVKDILLDKEVYRGLPGQYVVNPIDLPVASRVVNATPEKPLLSLMMDLDPLALSDIATQMGKEFPAGEDRPRRALFVGKAGVKMMETAFRITDLFRAPGDARVLGPLVLKEMFYHLLKGEEGPVIRQFVRAGSRMQKVIQAIRKIQAKLGEEVDVEDLAQEAGMGRSAFFKSFKEATAMSPIQYQKRLRLLEARRLMTDEGETAEGSAYKVGYESPSQFSREYSRMFGNSPFRDTKKIKETENYSLQI